MKLVIDPGHGGSDSGAVGNGLQEKQVVLQIARRVRDILSAGYVVDILMTRDSDIFIPLSERARMANSFGANYFFSVHINSGGGSGYEDYIYIGVSGTSTAAKKQRQVHAAVVPVLQKYGLKDRGTKQADYAVLRETSMDAILTEAAFIDTTSDAGLLKNPQFIEDISQAYANGIAAVMGLQAKAPAVVYIETGGLGEEGVAEAHRFMMSKGWYGQILYPGGGKTPFLRTGGLTPSMRAEAEAWLKSLGWYYVVKA